MVRNGRLMEERRAQRSGGAVRRILNVLADGERSVNEIVRLTGLSQPNVSNHLSRLRQRNWVRARRHGQQVRYALLQPDALPEEWLKGQGVPPAQRERAEPAAPIVPALAADYLAALLRLDEPRAGAVVEEALSRGLDWKTIALRVMTPALVRVGILWAEGELTVAEEHAATAMTTRLHERLAASIQPPEHPTGRAVVAGVGGNQHMLGVRMVADFLTAAGWESHYLGTDLPGLDLLSIVQRLHPDAVLLGVTLEDQLAEFWSVVGMLLEWRQKAGSHLPLIVGGGRYFAELSAAKAASLSRPGLDLYGSKPDALIEQLSSRLAAIRSQPA
jgi:MerR family transcriptional regulator, light-induced transcriptional regulator